VTSVQPDPSGGAGPDSFWIRLQRLLVRPSVRERVLAPMAFDASILVMNLITGITIARALGPAGRGEISAILMLTQIAAWIFSMGGTEAVSFRLAREPMAGARLLGCWLAISIPLALLAIVLAELVLPVLFNAQTEQAIHLARLYVPTLSLLMTQGVLYGILLGDQDFLVFNMARLAVPTLIAAGYIGSWVSGALSVELALAVNAAAIASGCLIAGIRSFHRHGLAPPDRSLIRETLWYGARAHAGSLAWLINARLDLLIIPAFLGAASVGLYSVATNTTSIIASMTGTIAVFVLPVAARRRQHSARTVVRTLQAVLLIGAAIALPMMVLAEVALKLVYGAEFGDAATAMRILLPGAVLNAATIVLWSGLLAADRPFLSSAATAPAAVLTVVGLLLFLRGGGIEAAAIVSSTAYTTAFVISTAIYRHIARLRWRDFLNPPLR
jgi:O-antigen/teichoic acid export membrane protein